MYHLKCLFNLRRKNIPQTCVTSYSTIIITYFEIAYFEITAFRENQNNNQVQGQISMTIFIYTYVRDTIP